MTTATEAVQRHVRSFFAGHDVQLRPFDQGPISQRVPEFGALEVGPGPRSNLWTYVSIVCWDAIHDEVHGHGLEFLMISPDQNDRIIELLAVNAYFHSGLEDQRLDLGHTVNLGEPWLPGSACDHGLISLPYPYGQDLEECHWEGGHARLLWLLPITKAERDFKVQAGLEALELRFEDAGLRYWEPDRASVVEAPPGRSYICRSCGQEHEGPPFSWRFAEPFGWEITQDRTQRLWGELYGEQAIIHRTDGNDYFMVGNIHLPVVDADEHLVLTVWVSLSEANFERATELWEDPGRVDEPPYFGWLRNQVPGYPDTLNLKTNMHTQPLGQRPLIELEPTDHPLSIDQREGVSMDRVIEFAEAFEEYMRRSNEGS